MDAELVCSLGPGGQAHGDHHQSIIKTLPSCMGKVKKDKEKSETTHHEGDTKGKLKSEHLKAKKGKVKEKMVVEVEAEVNHENNEGRAKQNNAPDDDENVNSEKRVTYAEKCELVCEIAQPLASKKLAKKLYRLIREASQHKTYLRNGLKEVQNKIEKGERGIVVFAGDVSPIEVMCHLPTVCEEKQLPYVYTPTRQDLGYAMGVRRGTLMVLIREKAEYEPLYNTVLEEVKELVIY